MNKLLAVAVLGLVSLTAGAQDAVKSVVIPELVQFAKPDIVEKSIVSDCALPSRMNESLTTALKAAGIESKAAENPQPGAGANVLQLEIADAVASGNAFVGHRKMVTVAGTLFQNGRQVGKFVATRNSGGGMGAGFKSSCAVLGRCTVTLGQDIAKWLASPVDGARLGDAR